MAVEVLRPHDLLAERFGEAFQCRRNLPESGNLKNSGRKQRRRNYSKPKTRKFNAAAESVTKKSDHGGVADSRREDEVTGGDLVMGRFRLLRRGESLGSLASEITGLLPIQNPIEETAVVGADKIGSDSPETVPLQIRLPADFFAESAYFTSPPPRSVPLPSYLARNNPSKTAQRGT